MSGGGAIVAIMAAQAAAERRIVDAFRKGDATRPERARSLAELGVSEDHALGRLQERGIVRTTGSGAYYLDEAAVIAVRDRVSPRAWRIALVVMVIALAALFLVLTRNRAL